MSYLSTDHIFNKIIFKRIGSYNSADHGIIFKYRIENVINNYSNIITLILKKFIMSSVLGSKIIACKIDNVKSSFDYIPGLREPLFQVLTNLRRTNFKYQNSMFPTKAIIEIFEAENGYTITGKDIKIDNKDIEIINPENFIGYFVGKHLKIELQIAVGFGYITKENNQTFIKNLKIDDTWIPFDVLFNPINFFNFSIKEKSIFKDNIFYDYIDFEFSCPNYNNPDEIIIQVLTVLKNMFSSILENNSDLIKNKEVFNNIITSYNVLGYDAYDNEKQKEISIVLISELNLPIKIRKILESLKVEELNSLSTISSEIFTKEKIAKSSLKSFVNVLDNYNIKMLNHELILEKINE